MAPPVVLVVWWALRLLGSNIGWRSSGEAPLLLLRAVVWLGGRTALLQGLAASFWQVERETGRGTKGLFARESEGGRQE